jgi:hypothetical protein
MVTHNWRPGIIALVILAGPTSAQQFSFRDVTREAGLLPHVAGIAGHAAAWGDIDGSGFPSLYVGSFGGKPYDAKTALFFRNIKGKFQLDEQPALRNLGRGNGAVFVDLTNSGRLDLYYTNHAIDAKPYGKGNEHFAAPNALFRNDGNGKFTDVSKESGACPLGFPARSVCALDFDGDGLVDLLVGECIYQGGEGRSRLFRNLGNYRFEDVTRKVGLPERIPGLGVAVADVNGDGWPDILLAGRPDWKKPGKDVGARLFLNDGKGHFKEVPRTHADFTWDFGTSGDNTTAGVCFADVNRDGLMDIVIGNHHSEPWHTGGVGIKLFLNRGMDGGWPRFEDVTAKVGLKPLPMKAPHVEIQDFDNDGWPDIYTSIIKFASGKAHPLIFKNLGVKNGLPQFQEDVLALNDFPTAEDRKMPGSGPFFDKLKKDGKCIYMAPGPSCDFDRDGRLDIFLANWWPDRPSLLLKNETKSGNWLQVELNMASGGRKSPVVNRQGIGSRINIYTAGKIGQKGALLGAREIAVGYGYASGQEAMAHFGLGTATTCDLEVILPHGRGKIERKGIKANQRLLVSP